MPQQARIHRVSTDLVVVNRKLDVISKSLKMDKLEILILASYPFVLLLGQMIALGSPSEMAQNYFTTKRNLFNVVFVKNGWFWTTLLYLMLIYSAFHDSTKKADRQALMKSTVSSLKKYAIVTVCWYFYSQWFFGLPIMDRVFLLTGGSCYNIPQTKAKKSLSDLLSPMKLAKDELSNLQSGSHGDLKTAAIKDEILLWSNTISSSQCRSMKGRWLGGHDPSGHVYILTLSSSFLLSALFSFYSGDELIVRFKRMVQHVTSKWRQGDYLDIFQHLVMFDGYFFLICLVTLWYWMLLMTSIYFHSMPEKIMGLLFSYLTSFVSNLI